METQQVQKTSLFSLHLFPYCALVSAATDGAARIFPIILCRGGVIGTHVQTRGYWKPHFKACLYRRTLKFVNSADLPSLWQHRHPLFQPLTSEGPSIRSSSRQLYSSHILNNPECILSLVGEEKCVARNNPARKIFEFILVVELHHDPEPLKDARLTD